MDQESTHAEQGTPVTVGHYFNLMEAQIAKSILEAEGIPAFVIDLQMGQLFTTFTIGGFRLQVRAGDEERAREILDSMPVDEDDGESAD